jgi:hypothetical protein
MRHRRRHVRRSGEDERRPIRRHGRRSSAVMRVRREWASRVVLLERMRGRMRMRVWVLVRTTPNGTGMESASGRRGSRSQCASGIRVFQIMVAGRRGARLPAGMRSRLRKLSNRKLQGETSGTTATEGVAAGGVPVGTLGRLLASAARSS